MVTLSVLYLIIYVFVIYKWFTFKGDNNTICKMNLQIFVEIMTLPVFVVLSLLIITHLP